MSTAPTRDRPAVLRSPARQRSPENSPSTRRSSLDVSRRMTSACPPARGEASRSATPQTDGLPPMGGYLSRSGRRIVQRWRPAFLPRACESQGMNPISNERKVALPFRTVTGAGESSAGLHPPFCGLSVWDPPSCCNQISPAHASDEAVGSVHSGSRQSRPARAAPARR